MQVGVVLDQNRAKARLENVPLGLVPTVEAAGIEAVQLPHPDRDIRERRLDDEVVVIDQQAMRVEEPAVSLQDLVEGRQKPPVIRVIAENRLARIPPNDDVVDRAWVRDPMGPGDPPTLALRRLPA